jgi:sugar lactone lactonase YvrE
MYVLDIGRSAAGNPDVPGKIIRIRHDTGIQTKVVPSGVGVEQPHNPSGIRVDAQGFLIVADADGYASMNSSGACPNGCGAVLRVNPATGAATVLSQGQLWSDPSALILPPDGDIVDGRGDVAYVADTRNDQIVKLNLSRSTGSDGYKQQSFVTDGLRAPSDIARDPSNGDFLVANLGSHDDPLRGVQGCDDDPRTPGRSESDGFVARIRNGKVVKHYCDPDFKNPRGISISSTGTLFVTDPFNAKLPGGDQAYYSSLFRIRRESVRALSTGVLFATPAGIAWSYSGRSLLVADEATFGPAVGDCAPSAEGCGGVLAVNPASGDQGKRAERGTFGLFRDPVDVVVDRRGGPATLGVRVRVRAVRLFGATSAPKLVVKGGRLVGIRLLKLRGFSSDQKVRLECLHPCKPRGLTPKTHRPQADKVQFAFPAKRQGLRGRFRIVTYVPSSQHHRTTRDLGRFRTYIYRPGQSFVNELDTGRGVGCLEPGATKVTSRTRAECPKPEKSR